MVIPLQYLLFLVINITIPNIIYIQCTKRTLSVHSLSWRWRMYTSYHWIIILNGIERIPKKVAIGLCFSNIISQKLLILLNLLPPKCKKTCGYRDNKWSGFLLFNWFLWCFLYHSPWCKEGAWKALCFF